MNHCESPHVQHSAANLAATDANLALSAHPVMRNGNEDASQSHVGPPKHSHEAEEAKRENEASSNEDAKQVDAKPAMVLRSRRRPRKARQKHDFHKEGAKDDKATTTIADLLLLNEVQEIRAKSRTSTKRIVKKQDEQPPPNVEQTEDGEDLIALRSNFSLERSTNVVEERMHKYIEERMKQKFGDRFGSSNVNATGAAQDSDLFDVPEHLKPRERPLYDPGEGLPAAGVEEVEISPQAKQKNIEETVKAHKRLLEKSRGTMSAKKGSSPTRGAEKTSLSNENGQGTKEAGGPSEHDSVTSPTRNAGQRRRYELATDGLAYERFKKRMRK